jgi:hypothetical protein
MKLSIVVLCLVLFQPLGARAQKPRPAGRSSAAHFEVGYSYANVSIPSTSRINVNGLDFGATRDISAYFGVEFSGSYQKGSSVIAPNQRTALLTYAGGVVVYPLETRHFSVRVRALFGGAKQEGANINSQQDILTGFVNQPAWIVGGGVGYKLDGSWSIRIAADYLRSSFFDPAAQIVRQNNFRAGVGIVYTLATREGRTHR